MSATLVSPGCGCTCCDTYDSYDRGYGQSVSARRSVNTKYFLTDKYFTRAVIMTRQRNSSYSSSTLSSTSSASSSGTYASISDSISSYASRLSLSLQSKSTDFWAQFDRGSRKRSSVGSVFKKMFVKRARGEPEKPACQSPVYPVILTSSSSSYMLPSPASSVRETSFIEPHPRVSAPLPHKVSSLPVSSGVPAGLYCVIEDFLTEYDLRLMEEEQRAEMLARNRDKLTEL